MIFLGSTGFTSNYKRSWVNFSQLFCPPATFAQCKNGVTMDLILEDPKGGDFSF